MTQRTGQRRGSRELQGQLSLPFVVADEEHSRVDDLVPSTRIIKMSSSCIRAVFCMGRHKSVELDSLDARIFKVSEGRRGV